MKILLLVFSVCFLFANQLVAKTLFEGYFKLDVAGQHVGYVVQKFEFLKSQQEYRAT